MRLARFLSLRMLMGLLSGLLLSACGGDQKGPRGPAFCASYEENYIESCLQQCESGLDLQDKEGREACQKTCREDLEDDDTWSEDCAK